MRGFLVSTTSFGPSTSSKESMRKSSIKDLEDLNYMALYENTGRVSEIHKIVNTSILPYSYENTEREFTEFSHSPLASPKVFTADINPTGLLPTDVTSAKDQEKLCNLKNLNSDCASEKSPQTSEDLDLVSIGAPNCCNYLMQLQGDDDETPCFSEIQSREGSVNY